VFVKITNAGGEERGFAAAYGTHYGRKRACGHLEVDVIKYDSGSR